MACQIVCKILASLCLLLVHSVTVSCHSLCKQGKDGLAVTPQLSLLSISASPFQLTMISTDLTVYEINSTALNTKTNQLHLVGVQSELLLSKWPSLELPLVGKNLSHARSIFTLTISRRPYLFLLFGTKKDGKEHKNDLILDLNNSSLLPISGLNYPLSTNFPIWISSSTGQLYLLYAQSDKSLLMQQMESLQSVISYHRFIGKAFPRILCKHSNNASVSVRFTEITDAENCNIVKWHISRGFAFNGSFFLFEGNKRVFRFAESTYDTSKFVPVTIIPQGTFFICPKVESFPELLAEYTDSTNANSSTFLTDKGKDQVASLKILILIIFLLLTVPLVILVLLSTCNCQRKYLPIVKAMMGSSFNRRSGIHKARGQISVPTIILSAATKNTMRMVAKAAAAGSIRSGGGGKVGSQLKTMRSKGSKLKKKSSKRRPSSKKVLSGGSTAKWVVTGKRALQAKLKKQSKGSFGSRGTGKVRFTPPTGRQARNKKASNRNPSSAGGSVDNLFKGKGSQRRVGSARKRVF